MQKSTRLFFVVLFALALVPAAAVLSGCGGDAGSPRQPVLGTLTFNGAPVPEAQVVFQCPEQHIYYTAITDGQGQFEVRAASGDGLPAATYQVTVCPAPSDEEGMTAAPERPDIPQKYRKTSTSDLKLTVAEGDNHFNLEMVSH